MMLISTKLTIQRSHHADPREHRRSITFGNKQQRPSCCGLIRRDAVGLRIDRTSGLRPFGHIEAALLELTRATVIARWVDSRVSEFGDRAGGTGFAA